MQSRISWIDVARGIGIIIVIYAHGLSADSYRHLFYSFHMPLFFFLSGIVFHHRKYEHFSHFFKKTVKGILLPYVIFALLSYLLWLSRSHIAPTDALSQLYGIFYGNGAKYLAFNNLLWFLPSLFVTKIGFGLLTKFTEKKTRIIFLLFLSSLVGYCISVFAPTVKLPFGIETVFTALVFFGAGYLWNAYAEKMKALLRTYALPLFLFSLIACITFATMNFNIHGLQVDMRLNRLHNYAYFYITALSGITSSIILSMIIQKNRVLEYIGKHSLVLFVWHITAFSYFTQLLRLIMDEQTLNNLKNISLTPLYTIGSIGIILFCSLLVKKSALYLADTLRRLKQLSFLGARL
ncbi:MAG: acyltransferase family protein [Candidatus Levybacteria bacterium]|nr:acyltransferase family protein [Candidatus Levybacteria bacterium]